MNKTVNINLAGTFFHIDEDAFAKLSRYLDAIRRSFSDPQGQDEIIKDIEARIAELFSEKKEKSSQVITIKELDEVIAVMGQPEDYMVDEEIFEDTPPKKKKQTKSRSYHKQLFRDVDNKFIAGVSSGLAHYLSIDALWIRLLWIAVVLLGFGSPIFIYLLLWILIPEAITTSDKLKMTREPVNISSIEKKIKDELNKASERIKDVDYDKHMETAKKGTSNFFDVIGKIILGIFKIFGKFFGIILIITSISVIVSLIVGAFTSGTFGLVWGNHEFIDYLHIVNTANIPLWLLSLLIFFAIGIPFFVLFILGLKLLVSNLKSIGTAAKIMLFVLWIFSIIGLGILGVKQLTEDAYSGEFIIEKTIPIKAGDTLKLTMNANKKYEYSVHRDSGFEIKLDDNNNRIIYANNIRLIVRSTKDSVASIFIEKKAEGHTFISAKENAEAIDFNYTLSNNTLALDGFFTTNIDNKYRDQEIEVVVYLPTGTILFADKNTYSFHRNYSRHNDILDNGDEEKYLEILTNDTKCLNCPNSITNNNKSSSSEDWENDLNKAFNNNNDEVEETNHIIINKKGVDINVTDKDDTIKIKIGDH